MMQTLESEMSGSWALLNYLKYINNNQVNVYVHDKRKYQFNSQNYKGEKNKRLTPCSIVEVDTVADGTAKDWGVEKSQKITCCKLVKT